MNKTNVTILGDYFDPDDSDFEGSLTFRFKSAFLERRRLWKSKDISAEFLGNFWTVIFDDDCIKHKLHFICAELLENAVVHGEKSDYIIMIHLCFTRDEFLVYVKNNIAKDKIQNFKDYANMLLESKNLQALFVKKMKDAKKTNSKKSQVGLITIIKDRGAKLAWKFKEEGNSSKLTTLARISLHKKGVSE